MDFLNFAIPSKMEALLSDSNDYYVKAIIGPKSINEQLTKAKQCLKDEGCEFILENFDVFYSILHHEATISTDVMFQSYTVLHNGINHLQKSVEFLLGEKANQSEEVLRKYQIVMKMLTYIYAQTIQVIELKNVTDAKNQGLLKGRKKATTTSLFKLDKKGVLLALNNIMQMEICGFWDPPVVEDSFINTVAEVCYKFLDNPSIKSDSGVKQEVFNLIGTLVISYNHSSVFTIRMAQMIKNEEHLVQCAADGIKQLVTVFNCKSLISGLIRELTDWQTDEQYQDSQGAKFSSQFLTALAVTMPNLMLPEVAYLNQYLAQEPASLRNAVLNVITEVVLNVLTKHSLNAEEMEFREGFLSILLEHMRDNSAQVRSRVMQHWTRLQAENAIPRHLVNEVLHNVVEYHLHDKAAIVRKNAARCVTTFLSHNTYSSQMSLASMKKELEANQVELAALKPGLDDALKFKQDEIEKEWTKCVPEMKQFILEQLQSSDDENEDETNNAPINRTQAETLIRMYLKSGKFKEAIQIWKTFEDFDVEDKENIEDIMEEFLVRLKEIYTTGMGMMEMVTGYLSEEDLKKLETLKEKEEFFTEAVAFLTHIDKAIKLMAELLETTSITDMQEAVAFFTVAYQFNIDNASYGISKMLGVMQRNEQDRKDMVTDAFKTIYLVTSTSNMYDHCVTIVDRLIKCIEGVSYSNWENLELIISEWVRKGILDNAVIDMLWQYYTKKQPVSDSTSKAAAELLRMAAIGRRSIITRNVKLVTSVGFTERAKNDLSFLSTVCKLLSLLGRDRIDVNSNQSPFKINHNDSMWKDLFSILLEKFFILDDFYYPALANSINFLYKVCGKPQEICEQFLRNVLAQIGDMTEVDRFIHVRLCQLLGICAINLLDFLDETVYKELKRRENYHNSRSKNSKKKTNKSVRRNEMSGNASTLHTSTANGDESTLEGAQAGDEDAEGLLQILETQTVTGQSVLGRLAEIVINVCEKPNVYNDVIHQGAAVTALIRYMLVSSQFCSKHIQLLFTLFEKTEYPEMKESILVHLSDLLTRFPNVIEPWTPRIYARLSDPDLKIRKATFFTLSSLILRDMIRAHSHIHLMVNSLIDDDEGLRSMCRTFFITLAQKEDNLYSLLPDIFSHLMESNISDEHSKDIMKFLFNLMDKAKQMENLVDRFCSKFDGTDNLRHQRNIAYCLSLIQYNEKALKKLQENFEKYKNLVHDPEIYASLKTITEKYNKQIVGKPNLKPIVAEIEKLINSVFDVREDGQSMPPPPRPKSIRKKKSSAKKPKPKRPISSDEDSD